MKNSKIYLFRIVLLLVLISCASRKELYIHYSDPQIKYSGRIDSTGRKAAELYWSGTTIQANFKGRSIDALFDDTKGDNYYDIIIDQGAPTIFRPDTLKQYYTLASGLSKGKHHIEIFKRTEWTRGTSSFYGFKIKGHPDLLSKPAAVKRKIEFYGNSITAGYAVEDFSGKDRPDSTFTNNYLSYAAITARHFNAQYQCICRSGIGITVSWFPQIMPELYYRLDPNDENSHWDFSAYTPDIVVINLFQNDSWIVNMPNNEQFRRRFGDQAPDDGSIIKSYENFVGAIREAYPNASIICMLGNMDITKTGSKWPGYVKQAVANLNDAKIYTLIVPFKNTKGHPSIAEQKILADHLIQFIDDTVKW
ncbi:MAG: electron transporter RnfD [Flavobacteriaceae bacterium]|nr:electron transporter RnfD [Flavobacteriaceae bacterium]